MDNRKIAYYADGVQLKISPDAPGFEQRDGYWFYRHIDEDCGAGRIRLSNVASVLNHRDDDEECAMLARAMISEAVTFWTIERHKFVRDGQPWKNAYAQVDAWISLLP